MRIALLVGLLLSGLILAPRARAENEPCRLVQIGHLDLKISPQGAALAPLNINGHPAWMFLGLGQGFTSLFAEALEPLELSAEELPGHTPTGSHLREKNERIRLGKDRFVEKYTRLAPLRLDKAEFKSVEATVIDRAMPLESVDGLPIVGTLGSGLFTLVDTELDLGHATLNLFRHSACGERVVYWGGTVTGVKLQVDASGTFVFPMELEGQRVETALQPARGPSLLDENAAKRFFGFDSKSKGVEHRPTPFGPQSSFRAMTLSSAGLDVRNAQIQLVPGPERCKLTAHHATSGAIGYADCFNVTPLRLGTGLLRQLRLYIASEQKQIYITRAGD